MTRTFLTAVLLAAGGCSTAPESREELQLRYSEKVQRRTPGNGSFDQTPTDAVRVTARVVRVDLPSVDSPSLAGDRATVVFDVPAGSLPWSPDCRRISLRYDPYANPFKEGATHVLLFLPDGRFWGGGSFNF